MKSQASHTITSPVLLAGAATSLGIALQVQDGRMHVVALLFMAIGLALTTRAVLGGPIDQHERHGPPRVEWALRLAIFVSLGAHLVRFPSEHFQATSPWMRLPFYLGMALVAALVWSSHKREGFTFRRLRLPLVISVYVALGAYLLLHAPDPPIDVFTVQRDSAAALLAGHNPYALTFPNIYGANTAFYGPGMVVGGRVQFGFVYPPLSLLLVLPGHLLGDFRFSHLMAMAAAAALMGTARSGRVGFLAATLYLFHPRNFYLLSLGWTEPIVVAMLALVAFCACRWRRMLPIAAGLFLVSKQYAVLALAPLLLLWPARTRWCDLRVPLVKALVVGAVVSLPLALWSFRPFWFSACAMQVHQPFRDDALSFAAAFAWLTNHRPSSAFGFLIAGIVTAMALRRCPHTPYGFGSALALIAYAFFAFNKQAFCNYYHFVLGTLCIAIAVWQPAPSPERPREPVFD